MSDHTCDDVDGANTEPVPDVAEDRAPQPSTEDITAVAAVLAPDEEQSAEHRKAILDRITRPDL